MLKSYLVLLMAIVFETVATSFLKQSEQFTKFWPSVVTVAGYAAAFYRNHQLPPGAADDVGGLPAGIPGIKQGGDAAGGQIEAFDAVIAVPAGAGGKPEGRTVRAAIET